MLRFHRHSLPRTLAVLCLLAFAGAASAAGLEEAGKSLIEKRASSIVTLRIVVQLGKDPSDSDGLISEVACATVTPEGLIVVPLTAIDPGQLVKKVAGFQLAMIMGDTSSIVKEMKLLAGGEEIPVEVVLRDPDLDLAVVRPRQAPAKPMPFIDLKSPAGDPGPLAPVLALSRMGKIGGRQINIVSGEIQAVIEKPRKFYVLHEAFLGFGAPVFTVDGKFVGVTILRTAPGGVNDAQEGLTTLSLSHLGALAVVLPAADIAEIVAKAATIKQGEPLGAATDDGSTTATGNAKSDAPAKEESPAKDPAPAKQ